MKRCKLVMVLLTAAFLLAGCADAAELDEIGAADSTESYQLADSENWAQQDHTPEQLAWQSTDIYQQMLRGQMKSGEGFEKTLAMACAESQQLMQGMEQEFKKGILSTIESLKNNDQDQIKQFYFSECIEDPEIEGRYVIFRIQEMESGILYYFRQDFIKEDGEWRIYGDNVANPFRLSR